MKKKDEMKVTLPELKSMCRIWDVILDTAINDTQLKKELKEIPAEFATSCSIAVLQCLLNIRKGGLIYAEKENKDPVTMMDIFIEKLLVAKIKEKFPQDAIQGEERTGAGSALGDAIKKKFPNDTIYIRGKKV